MLPWEGEGLPERDNPFGMQGCEARGMAGEAPRPAFVLRPHACGSKRLAGRRVLVTSHGGQPVTGSGMGTGGFFLCLSLFPEVHFFSCVKSGRSSGLKRCAREGEREKEGEGQRKSHQEQGCLGRA